jgi:hypothetical protein
MFVESNKSKDTTSNTSLRPVDGIHHGNAVEKGIKNIRTAGALFHHTAQKEGTHAGFPACRRAGFKIDQEKEK